MVNHGIYPMTSHNCPQVIKQIPWWYDPPSGRPCLRPCQQHPTPGSAAWQLGSGACCELSRDLWWCMVLTMEFMVIPLVIYSDSWDLWWLLWWFMVLTMEFYGDCYGGKKWWINLMWYWGVSEIVHLCDMCNISWIYGHFNEAMIHQRI